MTVTTTTRQNFALFSDPVSPASEFYIFVNTNTGVLTRIIEVFADGSRVLLTKDLSNVTVTANRPIRVFAGLTDLGVFESVVSGTDAADFLEAGSSGPSLLTGGLGDDTYRVTSASASVREGLNAGTDTVVASVDYTLTQNVENLTLVSTAIKGTGNNLDNILNGNGLDNVLSAGSGNDTLNGGAGNDTLTGASGDDSIDGGSGVDRVVYFGARSEFQIQKLLDPVTGRASFIVTSAVGRDFVTNVELFEFLDGTFNQRSVVNVAAVVSDLQVDILTAEIRFSVADENLDRLKLTQSFNGEFGTAGDIANDGSTTVLQAEERTTLTANDIVVTDGLKSSPRIAKVIQGSGNGDLAGLGNLKAGVTGVAFGFDGNDTLNGGTQNDVLAGGDGNDLLNGRAGNDTLDGGLGADSLMGGAGDDTAMLAVEASTGFETDRINLGTDKGDRVVLSGVDATQEVLVSFVSANVGNGNVNTGDELAVSLQLQSALNAGNPTGLVGGVARLDDEGIAIRGARMNVIGISTAEPTVGQLDPTQNRGLFDEVVLGTNGDDLLDFLQEADDYYVNGGAGNDKMRDGAGNDFLVGGSGSDALFFTDGQDSAIGGGGNDRIFAGIGNLTADGSGDFDTLIVDASFSDVEVRETEPNGAGSLIIGSQVIAYRNIESFQFNDITLATQDLFNSAPIAAADRFSTTEGDPAITGSVAANDTDPDGNLPLNYAPARIQVLPDGFVLNTDGTFIFDATLPAYDFVSAGRTENINIAYTVTDAGGASATATLTIAVAGINDDILLVDEDQRARVMEVTDAVEAFSDRAGAGSSIRFSDADRDDIHVVGVTPGGTGYRGQLIASVSPANNRVVNWSYDVEQVALDDLVAGEVVEQIYTLTIADLAGSSVTETVVINLVGEQDAATIVGSDSGQIKEAGIGNENSPAGVGGSLVVIDPDRGQAAFKNAGIAINGTYGVFTINADSSGWTYELDNTRAATQALTDDRTRIDSVGFDSFTVESLDGSASRIVSIQIDGTNDAPVVSNLQASETSFSFVTTDPDSTTLSLPAEINTPTLDRATVINGSTTTVQVVSRTTATTQIGLSVTDNESLNPGNSGPFAVFTEGIDAADSITIATQPLRGLLYGRGGNDTIEGSVFSDFLIGGAGDDRLTGGAGSDVFIMGGAAGSDTVTDLSSGDIIQMNVTAASTLNAAGVNRFEATADSFIRGSNSTSVATANFAGTAGGDLISLAAIATQFALISLTGGAGADTLTGSSGNDVLNGGNGADAMDGGAGNDRIIYENDSDAGTAGALSAAQGDRVAFATGEDTIVIRGQLAALAGTTNPATATAVANGAAYNGANFSGGVRVVAGSVNNTATATDLFTLADLQAAFGGITNEVAGDELLIAFRTADASATALYKWTASDNTFLLAPAGDLDAAELQLIGVFRGDVLATDFAFA